MILHYYVIKVSILAFQVHKIQVIAHIMYCFKNIHYVYRQQIVRYDCILLYNNQRCSRADVVRNILYYYRNG